MATLRTYSATVENLGGLMQLRLNEASGTEAIDSAGDLDGTYQGGVTLNQGGGMGNGAARFDGSDDQIFVATLSGTITVSAFGDSLMNNDSFPSADQQFSVVLETALDARGLTATVSSAPRGGQRTGDALDPRESRFFTVDEVLADDPDVVILELGTNDAIATIASETVEENLRDIITELQGADIEVLLTGAFAFYPDRNGGVGYGDEASRDEFEQIFPDLAAETGAMLLEDAEGSDKYLGGAREGTTITGGVLDDDDLNSDGLHPNPAGVRQIVPRILPQTIALGAKAGAIDEPLLLANGSFEVWFTSDTVMGDHALFSKNGVGQGTGGHVAVLIRDGTAFAAIGDESENFSIQSAAGVIAAGAATHLVLTFGDDGLRLFVNGVEGAADPSITIGLDEGLGNFEPLLIGSDDGRLHFDGVIDEFAVYGDALTSAQIASLFEAGQGGLTLLGTAANDDMFGGADDEDLRGLGGNDTISGGGGDDLLRGSPGNDSVRGDAGNDQIFGDLGSDTLMGGEGSDRMFGRAGIDTIFGGPGNDRLEGNASGDQMWGGLGTDVLVGGAGGDSLAGGDGDDRLFGNLGGDTMFGGPGNDRLEGNRHRDLLRGGPGEDQLLGNFGPDDLRGGPDDDLLVGGFGFDTLVGGGGSDIFRIDLVTQGIDRILDFQAGPGGDVLDLRNLLDFGPGDDAGSFVRLNQSSGSTEVAVNPDGAGADFAPVLNLAGVTGIGVGQLIADGNLELGVQPVA